MPLPGKAILPGMMTPTVLLNRRLQPPVAVPWIGRTGLHQVFGGPGGGSGVLHAWMKPFPENQVRRIPFT